MPGFGQLSFKWKLTLIIMGTSVVSLLAACAAFVWYDNYLFKTAMTRELEADAALVRSLSRICPISSAPGTNGASRTFTNSTRNKRCRISSSR